MVKRKRTDSHSHNAVKCSFCSNFNEFVLPSHLVDQLLDRQVVLFAGSGISTEDRSVLPDTFYELICHELKTNEDLSFPELMSKFCQQPNGRASLLRKIHERFEYIRSFSSLYEDATRFHREISTLYLIESIVTTNWDEYFERECGAKPFVTSEDFAFWSIPGRKVFKIHGSVNNIGSVIATAEDYARCYQQLQQGVFGSSLKMMLATKTILYVGYSFRDDDFLRIHSILRDEMGELLPHAYIVTIDQSGEERFRNLGLTPIFTDATYFISVLKQHILQEACFLPDDRFDDIPRMIVRIMEKQSQLQEHFNLVKSPDVVYSWCYQDGLLHCLQRILALQNTGSYSDSHNVMRKVNVYERIRKRKLREKNYFDVAYVEGYRSGLMFLLTDDEMRDSLPLYYTFGAKYGAVTLEEFKRYRRGARRMHKAAFKQAQEMTKRAGSDFVFRHLPLL